MAEVNFKFNEGDFVHIKVNKDLGNFMVTALIRSNGGNTYNITNGEELYSKLEYEIEKAPQPTRVKGLGYKGEK